MKRDHQYSNLIRLNDHQREGLLARMDDTNRDETPAPDDSNRREDRRWCYRAVNIRLQIEHPGGGYAHVLVVTRNLSAGGLSIIHGGFLHPQSTCRLELERLDGVLVTITGLVVSCRHIDGSLHEVGIKFDKRIDPRNFHRGARSDGRSVDKIELQDMSGTLLYIDDSQLDLKLLAHQLRTTNMKVLSASGREAAEEMIENETVDIVFCDLHVGETDGAEIIRAIRAKGFTGPIAIVSAETDGARLAPAREAGATYMLPKPVDTDIMFAMLAEMHFDVGAVVSNEQLYSSMEDDPSMHELIGEYIDQVSQMSESLQELIGAEEYKKVRDICMLIKGSALGYGFMPVSEAATDALRTLDSTLSVDESRAQLRNLMLLCSRMGMRKQLRGE